MRIQNDFVNPAPPRSISLSRRAGAIAESTEHLQRAIAEPPLAPMVTGFPCQFGDLEVRSAMAQRTPRGSLGGTGSTGPSGTQHQSQEPKDETQLASAPSGSAPRAA